MKYKKPKLVLLSGQNAYGACEAGGLYRTCSGGSKADNVCWVTGASASGSACSDGQVAGGTCSPTGLNAITPACVSGGGDLS